MGWIYGEDYGEESQYRGLESIPQRAEILFCLVIAAQQLGIVSLRAFADDSLRCLLNTQLSTDVFRALGPRFLGLQPLRPKTIEITSREPALDLFHTFLDQTTRLLPEIFKDSLCIQFLESNRELRLDMYKITARMLEADEMKEAMSQLFLKEQVEGGTAVE